MDLALELYRIERAKRPLPPDDPVPDIHFLYQHIPTITKVRRMAHQGYTREEMAASLGVSKHTISRILHHNGIHLIHIHAKRGRRC